MLFGAVAGSFDPSPAVPVSNLQTDSGSESDQESAELAASVAKITSSDADMHSLAERLDKKARADAALAASAADDLLAAHPSSFAEVDAEDASSDPAEFVAHFASFLEQHDLVTDGLLEKFPALKEVQAKLREFQKQAGADAPLHEAAAAVASSFAETGTGSRGIQQDALGDVSKVQSGLEALQAKLRQDVEKFAQRMKTGQFPAPPSSFVQESEPTLVTEDSAALDAKLTNIQKKMSQQADEAAAEVKELRAHGAHPESLALPMDQDALSFMPLSMGKGLRDHETRAQRAVEAAGVHRLIPTSLFETGVSSMITADGSPTEMRVH